MHLIDHRSPGWPLFGQAASRAIERRALAAAAPHALMARAGLDAARLMLALSPHARRVWVAAGPGGNGGDGLVAARHLRQAGLEVSVTWLAEGENQPGSVRWAADQARAAGLTLHPAVPDFTASAPDAALDALLGLGQDRAAQGAIAHAVRALNTCGAPVLALDVPTGLCPETGRWLGGGDQGVHAAATLSLLNLKPGLFTACGRDACGAIWFSTLGIDVDEYQDSSLRLACAADAAAALPPRRHAQHKGSFGDVWLIGGSAGMGGALQLAAHAALHAGAGRVYAAALDEHAAAASALQPELMPRSLAEVRLEGVLEAATVVAGCGGGAAVAQVLPQVLQRSARLVLDADALNAIAADTALAQILSSRAARGQTTVLTPHPLEAARLLQSSAGAVQNDRLGAARALAARFQAMAVLKGSGSVVAAPDGTASLNPTGDAGLGTPGSGDVLAGWLGGLWSHRWSHLAASNQAADDQAAHEAAAARQAAIATVWLHGRAAELARASRAPCPCSPQPPRLPVLASHLAAFMTQAADELPSPSLLPWVTSIA